MFFPVNGGVVRNKDPRQLAPGELAGGVGLRLRKNDPRAYSTGTRQSAGTLGAGPHNGLIFAEFDAGGQILIGAVGSFLYEDAAATAGVNGHPVQLEGSDLGFSEQPSDVVGEVQNENLYVAAGVGLIVGGEDLRQNPIRQADGTWRRMGLMAPGDVHPGDYFPQPVGVTVAGSPAEVPDTGAAGTYFAPDGALQPDDTHPELYSYAWIGSLDPLTPVVTTWIFSGTYGDGQPGRVLTVRHAGLRNSTSSVRHPPTQKIEISLDAGATWTTLAQATIPYHAVNATMTIDPAVLFADIQVKATTQATENFNGRFTGQIFSIRVQLGQTTVDFGDIGCRYIVSEYRSSDGKYGEFSKESEPVTGTASQVQLPMPDVEQNGSADFFAVWRSAKGSAEGEFDRYYRVGLVSIERAGTTWSDFLAIPIDELGEIPLPVLQQGTSEPFLFYQRDLPPPVYYSIAFLDDCLLGLTHADPRMLYYSPKGRYESRPALYALPIRSPRNDTPIAVSVLNGVALVWMKAWTKRVRAVSQLENGLFDQTDADDASERRGLAGVQSFCTFMFNGKPFWFCVDLLGPYITDGYQFIEWDVNIRWFYPKDPASGEAAQEYAHLTVCRDNPTEEIIEVRYVPQGGTSVSLQWDFNYGVMSKDQPTLAGPHPVINRMMVQGNIDGLDTRWSGGEDGAIYQEGVGTVDASLAYAADGSVPRVITTGAMPLSGLGGLVFVKHAMLRVVRGAYAAIATTWRLTLDSGEVQAHSETVDPNANDVVGLSLGGETLQVVLDDTGTGPKAPIMGIYVEAESLGKSGSATRANTGAVAGTVAV